MKRILHYRYVDKYSKEMFSGDIAKRESYYKDRGHVAFEVKSTQVSITPDKRDVYITMNVSEGGTLVVERVHLADHTDESVVLFAPPAGQVASARIVGP